MNLANNLNNQQKADSNEMQNNSIGLNFGSFLSNELLDQMPEAIVITDLNGDIIGWYGGSEDVFGYKNDEILGQPSFILLKESERAVLSAKITNAIENDGIFHCEVPCTKKNGAEIYIESTSKVIRNKEGNPFAVVGINKDITEKKNAEQALRESRKILESVFEHMHMLVAYLDSNFNFVRVNQAYAEAYNAPSSFFPGKNYFGLYPNEYLETKFQNVIETKEPYFAYAQSFEYTPNLGRGTTYWDWSLIPIEEAAGEVSGLVLTLQDVTEKEKTQQSLVESEQKFKNIFKLSPEGIVLLDKTGTIVDVNHRVHDWVGYEASEFVGKRLLELPCFDDKTKAGILDMFRRRLMGENVGSYEVLFHRRDGSTFVGLISASVIQNGDENAVYDLVLVSDVTSLKEQQNTLLEAKMAAECANRTKSEFLANVSHELRTPLNSIIGFSDVMLEGYTGELKEKQEKYLNNISISGKNLLTLINNVLDLSKIEAGRMEYHPTKFDVVEMFDVLENIFLPMTRAKNISLHFKCISSPFMINADYNKMEEIFNNLLSNAVKFTPEGGSIEINTNSTPYGVKFSVKDNGIGIPEDKKDIIFEPFKQVESFNTREHSGTGLGLCLVKKFVDMHGGTLAVESQEGNGSEFSFVIPG